MSGFEESGLPGRQSIREGFQGASEPETFITAFQKENCILLTSLEPALHLLDLQDVKRVTFHQGVIQDLVEKLKNRIKDLNEEEKLCGLLDHIFQFIHVDKLRPIIMTTMKKVKNIKADFIEQIAAHEKLYQDCPIEVKRRVWMNKHPLFGDAVGPILNRYIEEKDKFLYDLDNIKIRSFYSIPPRQRRQKGVVKELVSMIGNSVDLYNLVLQFLRTLFLKTKEKHYCSLRGELLMAFHDADVKEIRQVDPCHKFAWLLDACIREKSIDSKRLKELQTSLDNIRKTQEEVMGDIAMILCDPYATNTIVLSIIQQLEKIMKSEKLPRSSTDLIFLCKLLSLSVNAWQMLKSQNFKEFPENQDIIIKFMPSMISLILDSNIANMAVEPKVPESFWSCIKEDLSCQCIFIFFVNRLFFYNKRSLIHGLVPTLSKTLKDQPLTSSLVNLIVSSILRHPDSFSDIGYCKLIFDNFLLTWVQSEEILHHTVRLLWCVYEKLDSQMLVGLLTSTQPNPEHSEEVHDVHSRLVDLIAAWKANTPSSSDRSNSSSPALSLSPVVSPGLVN